MNTTEIEKHKLANNIIYANALIDGVVSFDIVPAKDSGCGVVCVCRMGGATHRVRSHSAEVDVAKMVSLVMDSIEMFDKCKEFSEGGELLAAKFITDAK
jgi:hypothetical protein